MLPISKLLRLLLIGCIRPEKKSNLLNNYRIKENIEMINQWEVKIHKEILKVLTEVNLNLNTILSIV